MRRYIFQILFAACAVCACAQIPSDSIRVSLVTTGPGDKIWQLEGHAALRVQIGETVDMAVNYGMFDFQAPNFVYRFVKGETDYMCAAYPFSIFVSEYITTGRWIHEYPLNLNREEAEALMAYLSDNLQPQNATYRYNYVKDNCATRPVQLVERALGDTLTLIGEPLTDCTTFRDVMRHYHANYPWYQFGIDLALGSGIDHKIGTREKVFAPVLLDSIITTAIRPDGQPLTNNSIRLYDGISGGTTAPPTPWPLTPMAISLYLLAATTVIVINDIRRNRISRWYDAIVMAVAGTGGCIIAFLVFVSVHEATSPNWLLIWLNPLSLLVPALIFIKKAGRLLLYYEIVNFVAIILLAILWPLTGQSGNTAFVPLALSDGLLSVRYIYVYLQCAKKAN